MVRYVKAVKAEMTKKNTERISNRSFHVTAGNIFNNVNGNITQKDFISSVASGANQFNFSGDVKVKRRKQAS